MHEKLMFQRIDAYKGPSMYEKLIFDAYKGPFGGVVSHSEEKNVLFLSKGSEWLLFNANSVIFRLYHGERTS